MKGAQARPVGEECVSLSSDGGRGVGELQQGEVGLLHPFQDSHVLPLRTQHPTPEQVQLTAGQKKGEHDMSERSKRTDDYICKRETSVRFRGEAGGLRVKINK